jgi:hypothetical protein
MGYVTRQCILLPLAFRKRNTRFVREVSGLAPREDNLQDTLFQTISEVYGRSAS